MHPGGCSWQVGSPGTPGWGTVPGIPRREQEPVVTITLEQVREAAREAVLAKPDGYTYPTQQTCMYFLSDGQPGCLVGQVLYRLAPDLYSFVTTAPVHGLLIPPGVDPMEFETWNRTAWKPLAHCLRVNEMLDITDEAIQWLTLVQRAQDSRLTWAESLDHADNHTCISLTPTSPVLIPIMV